jgi:glycosyltransferase involved in cell wall biosynthesis
MSRRRNNPTIAFDTWILGSGAGNHGACVYAAQLLNHFRELGSRYSVQVRPYFSTGTHNVANTLTAAPGFQPRQTGLLKHSRLWRFGGASALAAVERVDLVFNPLCTTLHLGGLAPTVTTIHDLIPVVMPWESRVVKTLRFLLWSAVRWSRAIITVSQHSKTDLMQVYGLPESRIFVVYNGCDHDVFNDTAPDGALMRETRRKFGLERPYVLHYGAIKPNKNLKRLVLAHRRLVARNPNLDCDLVLAGTPDSSYEEVLATARQNGSNRGHVILTGAVNQQELVNLIKGASLAVFPSLYEGFCLPMIESMACGAPTIAANSSCLPEISGGVLKYFDPRCEEEMSECMEVALESQDLRRELAERGRSRAREFEWRRCAERTMEVLAELALSS